MDSVAAINPDDGRPWQIGVPRAVQQRMLDKGRGRVLEFAEVVVPNLMHPAAVFRGIRDSDWGEGDDEGLCYVCTPTAAYDYKRHVEVNAWPGQVLLVFVNGERELYNWRWERADPERPDRPLGWETRFRESAI